ncbi:C45 family autoproteolytic acyltransferase/hydolase [Loktanella sp. M215]|uniref:C45 family autoproteolytic acyltransferase/hydolase n=1 Tax=Loktanella sp. M215 TaxID=2675431 RepID=UPI001F2B3B53|nr:C45 family peptidase [Loktanella sp. M215]MCF7699467.1 hypothetical protein [Loktanella sp. M215]
MTEMTLTFDAVSEATPGPKWAARWNRSWPAYEPWFIARGGDNGPDRTTCRDAIADHMPELLGTYDRLVDLAGGGDRAARFLSTWCPPQYLGGCSLAAVSDGTDVRLVRNYDLSPNLNEGLMLHTAWTGRRVMGMVEFLWGLSDGINDAGLSIALAYGGRTQTGRGFGITTILRYVMETCDTVNQALAVLDRVPSHMAYNVVVADAGGNTASVELSPGGGARRMPQAIATNHQSDGSVADRPSFTRTHERHAHLRTLRTAPRSLSHQFRRQPLLQDRYTDGFGTLFTAAYDPKALTLDLTLPDETWAQSMDDFREGQRVVTYRSGAVQQPTIPQGQPDWSGAARIDWMQVGQDYAAGRGRAIESYLPF